MDGSLRALALIESGLYDSASREIEQLEKRGGTGPQIAAVLTKWLDRRRGVAGNNGETTAAGTTMDEAASSVEELKNEGLNHYSEGRLEEAVKCWRRALDASPDDAELHRFLRRAQEVLENRQKAAESLGGEKTGTTAP